MEHSTQTPKPGLKTLPRGLIFILDMSIVLFSLSFSRLLRYNFDIYDATENFFLITGIAFLVNAALFYVFRTFYGIVRYTTIKDSFRIISLNFFASIAYIIIKLAIERYAEAQGTPIAYLTWVTIFTNFFIASFLLIGYKTAVRYAYKTYFSGVNKKDKIKIAVYDAGPNGISTKRVITENTYSNMNVVYFLDDNPNKRNKTVEGVPILSTSEENFIKLKTENVKNIIIAQDDISSQKLNDIVDISLKNGIRVQQVPPIDKWLEGKHVAEQIKNINIEDLLGRDVININNENVFAAIKNKRILVTGAAGSIGSEIVRQLLKLKPAMVVMCDKAESPLHELQLEVEEKHGIQNIKAFIGNICDPIRMEQLFEVYHPEIVFHAAAYKHVPLMEANPSIAVLNNIMGTKILAELAISTKVKKFVMVSTDKAVNPTNVMGATKRIAEIFAQGLNAYQIKNVFSENDK